jgi:hypothetical protein
MLRFCSLYVSILTICLFQSFKERLLLPIEATWWAICAALFRCLQRPVWLGLQRYESFFTLQVKNEKNLLFSFFFTCYCFRLKRCAKVREKFDFQNLNEKFLSFSSYSRLSCLPILGWHLALTTYESIFYYQLFTCTTLFGSAKVILLLEFPNLKRRNLTFLVTPLTIPMSRFL